MGSWNRSIIVVLVALAVGCAGIQAAPIQATVDASTEVQSHGGEEEECDAACQELVDEILGDGTPTDGVTVAYHDSESPPETPTPRRHHPSPLEILGVGIFVGGVIFLAGLVLLGTSNSLSAP